jgi:hypothetical protein
MRTQVGIVGGGPAVLDYVTTSLAAATTIAENYVEAA